MFTGAPWLQLERRPLSVAEPAGAELLQFDS